MVTVLGSGGGRVIGLLARRVFRNLIGRRHRARQIRSLPAVIMTSVGLSRGRVGRRVFFAGACGESLETGNRIFRFVLAI